MLKVRRQIENPTDSSMRIHNVLEEQFIIFIPIRFETTDRASGIFEERHSKQQQEL